MESSDLLADRYPYQKIEKKWQDKWFRDKLYRVNDKVNKPKWYELTMYPYPSGDMHIGHWYAMTPSDTRARFRRMQGYNVLHPMGFDAFGLPAENAAIKHGIHPYQWTMKNIENMRRQLKSMGTIYDWDREIVTCNPEYYKWNQWIFLKMYEKGLAYRTFAPANWCNSCNTVLANEQVLDNGLCERCDTEVVKRDLNQWFLQITKYAEELLDQSKNDWPESALPHTAITNVRPAPYFRKKKNDVRDRQKKPYRDGIPDSTSIKNRQSPLYRSTDKPSIGSTPPALPCRH